MARLRGFTLIELLVVIAIIGILATLVITQLGGARAKAVASGAKSDVAEAGKAIEVFKLDTNASGGIILNTSATADTLGSGSNSIADIFKGNISTTAGSLSYGLKFTKTSGKSIVYTYKTASATAPSNPAVLAAGCYVFSAAGTDLGTDAYYAQDGTTGSVAVASLPVPTATSCISN